MRKPRKNETPVEKVAILDLTRGNYYLGIGARRQGCMLYVATQADSCAPTHRTRMASYYVPLNLEPSPNDAHESAIARDCCRRPS